MFNHADALDQFELICPPQRSGELGRRFIGSVLFRGDVLDAILRGNYEWQYKSSDIQATTYGSEMSQYTSSASLLTKAITAYLIFKTSESWIAM